MNQPEFGLYSSSAELPLYERGEAWQAYVERGPLEDLIVGEPDIEAYDWDNQVLILTAEASHRIPQEIGKFIAVLGQKRLYGGKGLAPHSAMAVRHPVIWIGRVADRALLFLRARHGLLHRLCPAPADPVWEAITAPAVRARFEALGKLRQPQSERAFQEFQAAVARIRILCARATAEHLELEYELRGSRVGAYHLAESLSMRWGPRFSASFGPKRTERLELPPGAFHRRVVFPYQELDRYGSSKQGKNLAQTEDGRVPDPIWILSVSIRPSLTQAESTALGLVEQLRLAPNGWGGSVMEDSQSAQLPLIWDTIPDHR